MTLHSSQMSRGGHRDDRRRRLLAEDLTANSGLPAQDISGAWPPDGQPPAHKSENYGDAEFLQKQLRLTDLIPRHLLSYLLFLIVGLTAIGGLIALYLWIPEMVRDPQPRPAMADLGNCGSLGNWFASLLLLAASLLAIAIYSVRRHKVDDYRGHYHVWLWAAGCWFTMATDVAGSLHQGLQQMLISVTGTRITGDGSIWWVVPSLFLVGPIGSRLLVDMWSSRLSSAVLVLAAVAYLTSLTAFFHGVVLQSEVAQLLLVQGVLLGGHLLLAMSMGLHARYVLLDAEGVLHKRSLKEAEKKQAGKKAAESKNTEKKAPEQKTDKLVQATMDTTKDDLAENDSAASGRSDAADSGGEKESFGAESGDTWVAVDPPHGGLQPVLKRLTPAQVSAAPASAPKTLIQGAASPPFASASNSGKLSKADRKALKKKLLEARMKRQRGGTSNW